MAGSILIIDLREFLGQPEKLREAYERRGCFRTTNHSVQVALMAGMKAVVRSLLGLPMEIKRRNSDVVTGKGYMAPSHPLYEALRLYNVGSSAAVDAYCSQLQGSSLQRDVEITSPILK